MKVVLFRAKTACLKLAKFFDNARHVNKRGFFGLGQFMLLIGIAPFIFDLKLYSFSELEEVPSLYEYDANRFGGLSRTGELTGKERRLLKRCEGSAVFLQSSACESLKKKQNKLESKQADFRPELISKPQPLPPIQIKQQSSRSFTALLNSRIAVSEWQDTGALIWLFGALLIVPTMWLCVRRRCWSLLVCGLSIPAFNYAIFLLELIPSINGLSAWKVNSSLAAQVAFAWFAIKGHFISKSFGLFILVLSLSVTWAALLRETDFSMFKAQLPIIAFVVAAVIARLVVKGVQENAYLFVGKGLMSNARKALHSLVLWLPMALLAFPIFYFTQTLIPQSIVNHLHKDQVLQFDYSHDVLDNSLQSVAVKTDDAIFAWYLNTQNLKRDILAGVNKLQDGDLRKSVEVTFDKVMPGQLDFEEYESDRFIIGEGVELAVDVAQNSTNKAFGKLRSRMRKKLGDAAASYETKLKAVAEGQTEKALGLIDQLYKEGQEELLKLNQNTQSSLWWTINYLRAAHTLTFLLFVFVCLKSFLYVLSRVSFNRDTGTFVTLGKTDGEVENIKSKITPTGLQYIIEADDEKTFYISRRFQCRGKAPNYTIPQPLKACLSRLLTGALSMNKVIMRKGEDAVRCTATQGIEFFEWDLAEGEDVLFDFHNFVGMSDSIKITTLVSTRASSLLLGKMIHSQAIGPGKLILMAEGRAEITDSELNGGSVPPERIIASQKDTRFHIDSELDIVNIYLSTAFVRPTGGGQVIVDVDSQRGTRTGLGSFFRRFILPI